MSEKVLCQCCGIEHYKMQCQICGKEFNAVNKRNTFCSVSCIEKKRYCKEKPKQCIKCGEEFLGKRSKTNCDNCRKKARVINGSKNMIKMKKTLGVENPMQLDWIKEKAKQTCIEKFGVDSPLKSKEVKEKMRTTCKEKYGVDWPCMRSEYRKGGRTLSSVNKTFGEKIGEGILYEFALEGYSYDLKLNNILIDINPYPYHNLTWHPYGNIIKADYHQKRAELAHKNGYQYIAVFDRDDHEKIIDMLKNTEKKKYYARKLEVRLVDIKEAKEFLYTNHLQSDVRSTSYIALGLYDNDQLIMLTTRGKPRYNKNYQYELLRLCSKGNAIVVGGFKKLLSYFVENYSVTSIISYCDMSKFNGSVYRDSGFSEKKNRASLHFYNPKTGQHFTNSFLNQKGFDLLMSGSESLYDCVLGEEIFRVGRVPENRTPIEIKKGDPIPFLNNLTERSSTDNRVLMEKFGFVTIPDCGQTTYTLNLDSNE